MKDTQLKWTGWFVKWSKMQREYNWLIILILNGVDKKKMIPELYNSEMVWTPMLKYIVQL